MLDKMYMREYIQGECFHKMHSNEMIILSSRPYSNFMENILFMLLLVKSWLFFVKSCLCICM